VDQLVSYFTVTNKDDETTLFAAQGILLQASQPSHEVRRLDGVMPYCMDMASLSSWAEISVPLVVEEIDDTTASSIYCQI
jgi:hypothetical protein